METSSQLKPFQCPIHPNDTIQRVSLSQKAPFPLFCIECILNPQIQSLQIPMTNLASFLDETSQHYRASKTLEPLSSTIPDDFLSVLKTKQDAIAEFTQHIEYQKAQVTETAAQALEIIKKCLDQKRDELLQNLDLQLIIFKTNFQYYEAKINSFYGNKETATPPQDKDQLIQRINSFEEIEQFVAFLQQVKDDLKENQRNQRDAQINQRLREMSNDLMEQAKTPSQNSFKIIKDQDEIFSQVKTNVLPIISECFAQVSAPIELLSYVGYSGIDIDKLVHLLQTDEHAINDIFKHINKPSTNNNLAEIFLEKEASFKKLSNAICSQTPNKDKALLILCYMLDDKTMVPIMKKYSDQCVKSMGVGLKSENEQVLLAILRSIQAIFSDPYSIFPGKTRDIHSIFHQKGVIRNLIRLRESKYSSVRDLYKQTISYIGYESDMEDEEYSEEESDYEEEEIFEKKPKKRDEEYEAIFEKKAKAPKEPEDEESSYEEEDEEDDSSDYEEEIYEQKKLKLPKTMAKPAVKKSFPYSEPAIKEKKY